MHEDDVRRVVDIASVCYPQHYEDMAIFLERLKLCPEGCFSLETDDGRVEGYILSYPWKAEGAPPLNQLVLRLPAGADVFYLHDLALMPQMRGQGHAASGLRKVLEAAGDRPLTLVSVNGTVPFWTRLGFQVVDSPALREKLASYGEDARYMERRQAGFSTTIM